MAGNGRTSVLRCHRHLSLHRNDRYVVYVTVISISVLICNFAICIGTAQYYAMALLPLSLIIICYALSTYLWRATKIGTRDATRWDDPSGPIVITVILIFALTLQFIQKVRFVYSRIIVYLICVCAAHRLCKCTASEIPISPPLLRNPSSSYCHFCASW